MNIFSAVLFCCTYPVLPIVFAVLGNETKPKKNLILGVTLPYAARTDPEVLATSAAFRKSLWRWAVPLTLALCTMFVLPWMSVQLTVDMVWMVLALTVPFFLRARVYRRLRALKRARGWETPGTAGVTVADLSAVGRQRKPLPAWIFLPPLALSLIPAVLALREYRGEELAAWMSVALSCALVEALGLAFYPLAFRRRADVVDGNTRRTAALTNVRRSHWGSAWLAISWSTALFSLCFWIWRESGAGLLAASCVYTLAVLYFSLRAEFAARHAQELLTAHSGTGSYVDEDDLWLWGMFYVNPNDRHSLVNDRIGMGMTVNLARPAGKIVMGFTVLCIAALPFLGVWVMAEEFSPRQVAVADGAVTVTHLTEQLSVPLAAVTDAGLLEELPDYSRIAGTAMDTIQEGRYRVDGYGVCRVSFNPREGPFIVLQTETETYIFGADDPAETRAVFARIRSMTDVKD